MIVKFSSRLNYSSINLFTTSLPDYIIYEKKEKYENLKMKNLWERNPSVTMIFKINYTFMQLYNNLFLYRYYFLKENTDFEVSSTMVFIILEAAGNSKSFVLLL